ncbi:GNAT family N-acetyltransferase [Pantoea sp. S62]|nr:GNAT family N-acetyltransferase [Pantoea sp. S62]
MMEAITESLSDAANNDTKPGLARFCYKSGFEPGCYLPDHRIGRDAITVMQRR